MNDRCYTGVGAREDVPDSILLDMTSIASWLESAGFHLRGGDADGSDHAFSIGVKDPANKTIYDRNTCHNVSKELWERAVEIANENFTSDYHRRAAQKYMNIIARNAFQVLGDDLKSPSKFVTCWTKNGKDIGGTGTTIRIAIAYNVPVYNLFNLDKKFIIHDIFINYT
jgi:hypothetical protein